MGSYYRRNLPHYQPECGEFFVTFRLVDSLPKAVVAKLKQEKKQVLSKINPDDKLSIANYRKRHFAKFDEQLDKSVTSNHWLKEDNIAKIVAERLHEFDNLKYILICYCIMSNHVHLLFKLLEQKDPAQNNSYPVTDIMKLIKGGTAYRANKLLNRKGQFWQHESYDHLIRNDKERKNIIRYILLNPVKAGLINNWKDWILQKGLFASIDPFNFNNLIPEYLHSSTPLTQIEIYLDSNFIQ